MVGCDLFLSDIALTHVWIGRNLADQDFNGRLSREEFGTALYLVQMAERRQPLPTTLPRNNAPPSPSRQPPLESVPSIRSITEDVGLILVQT